MTCVEGIIRVPSGYAVCEDCKGQGCMSDMEKLVRSNAALREELKQVQLLNESYWSELERVRISDAK